MATNWPIEKPEIPEVPLEERIAVFRRYRPELTEEQARIAVRLAIRNESNYVPDVFTDEDLERFRAAGFELLEGDE